MAQLTWKIYNKSLYIAKEWDPNSLGAQKGFLYISLVTEK